MQKTTILIADDHRILADSLRVLLMTEPSFEVVGIAGNGNEVLQFLSKQKVDLILLDINMPEMDGLETTMHIKQIAPFSKVLVLSTHDDGGMINTALKNGASGYLLKSTPGETLIQKIKSVINGQKVLSNHLTSKMIEFMHSGTAPKTNNRLRITRREKEILHLIGEELTTKEIADQLFVSMHTVITHRKNLLEKFAVKNSVGLIRKSIEMGIIQCS